MVTPSSHGHTTAMWATLPGVALLYFWIVANQ